MSDSKETEPSVGEKRIEPERASKRRKKTEEEKKEARRLLEMSLKAPKTPLMLKPREAWRQLCAGTGCGIAFGTFSKWIRDGKVPVIRLGGRIFVPKKILESLIDHCFKGEPLF